MLNAFTKKYALFSLFLVCVTGVNAHEVWLEQAGNGLARVYLGEPGVPDTGDKLNSLKTAQVFTNDRNVLAPLSPQHDHLEAAINDIGDVRLFADQVWQPWPTDSLAWWEFWKDDTLQGTIFEAKGGRSETSSKLNFELVPVVAGGTVFTALFQDKPLPNQEVTVFGPDRRERILHTNGNGQVGITSTDKGHFLLSSKYTVNVDAMHSGKAVVKLTYVTSLTFTVE